MVTMDAIAPPPLLHVATEAAITAKKIGLTSKIATGTAPKDNSRQLAPRCAMQAYHHGTPDS
jgi:hypothetical protein